MPTRKVVLTPRDVRVIEGLVTSGRYRNASEVLSEGLRLIAERDAAEVRKLKALRAAAKIGFDALDAGQYHELSDEELPAFIGSIGRRAGSQGR